MISQKAQFRSWSLISFFIKKLQRKKAFLSILLRFLSTTAFYFKVIRYYYKRLRDASDTLHLETERANVLSFSGRQSHESRSKPVAHSLSLQRGCSCTECKCVLTRRACRSYYKMTELQSTGSRLPIPVRADKVSGEVRWNSVGFTAPLSRIRPVDRKLKSISKRSSTFFFFLSRPSNFPSIRSPSRSIGKRRGWTEGLGGRRRDEFICERPFPSFLAVREEKLMRLIERHEWNALHLEAYSLFRDFGRRKGS